MGFFFSQIPLEEEANQLEEEVSAKDRLDLLSLLNIRGRTENRRRRIFRQRS